MTSWSQGAAKERVGDIPERRHDVQLLNDTIHSIKASFRHLEQSCTALDRKVSKSRTRMLSQLMHARRTEQPKVKPNLPQMPWSEPRVDSRPLARVYAAAAAAAHAKAVEDFEREEMQTSTMSGSELSGESSLSLPGVDLDALAYLNTLDAPHQVEDSQASEDISRPSSFYSRQISAMSPTSALSWRSLGVGGKPRRTAITAAQLSPESTPENMSRHTSGSVTGRVVAGGLRQISGEQRRERRPQSHVRLSVQANRPFSAPRMRYQTPKPQGADSGAPASKPSRGEKNRMPRPRPSSAVGKTPRADGSKGGIAMPPSRPKSAFAPNRRKMERMRPLMPECEPQARWMTEGA